MALVNQDCPTFLDLILVRGIGRSDIRMIE